MQQMLYIGYYLQIWIVKGILCIIICVKIEIYFDIFWWFAHRQEAILAAISEKDAHIALLEMAPNKKTENIEEVEKLTREKLRLQQVLKDLVSAFAGVKNTLYPFIVLPLL